MTKIKYFLQVARWMWAHRTETNCRQKWRRMDRELTGPKRWRT